MDHFLDWYSQNNKNVILILSTVIGLGLIYFLYRMLFVPQSAPQENSVENSFDPVGSSQSKKSTAAKESTNNKATQDDEGEVHTDVEVNPNGAIFADSSTSNQTGKKNNEQRQSDEAVATVSAAGSTSATELDAAEKKTIVDDERIKVLQEQLDAALNDLKQSKAEISRSMRVASAAQDELSQLKNQIKNQNNNGTGIQYVDTTKLEGDEAMIQKIDELQTKLQEYDIISDDISELQNLRKMNAELTKQLAEKS